MRILGLLLCLELVCNAQISLLLVNSQGAGEASGVAPSITSPPNNVTCITNTTTNFSVTASGTAPLSYRWRSNLVDMADVAGQYAGTTTNVLWCSNVVIAQSNLSFTCYVTNLYGSVTSASAVLTVTNGVSAATIPGVFVLHTNSSDSATALVNTLSNVPSGAVIVACAASEQAGDGVDFTVTSSPSLAWKQITNSTSANSGGGAVWWAYWTNGGGIRVTNTQDVSARRMSCVSYAITNAETSWGGAKAKVEDLSQPLISLTTTRANSLLVAMISDWNAASGTAVFTNTPSVACDVYVSGTYRAYYWTKAATSTGSYQQGVVSPTGQAAAIMMVEVRAP